MIKQIPNLITCCRILLSAVLLFLKPASVPFFVVYFLCGLSDVADGYIARKTGAATTFGAALDSVADFTFIVVILIVYVPTLHLPVWVVAWVGAVALVRVASLVVGYLKYRAMAFFHTIANKATGMALILFPFFELAFGMIPTAILLCGIASLSAVEELIIQCTSRELNRDARGIFLLK